MRRTKRFASFALAACMGVSLLVNVPAGTVSAAEPEEVVTAEVSATETDAEALDENQETVYYDASDADEDGFVWDGTTIVKYVGEGGDVKIPDGCTSIGGYYINGIGFSGAFDGCSRLTSIDIPTSVTSIGERAFAFCYGLTDIDIPSSVTSIGEGAFQGCKSLNSIEIPSGVISIGARAFYGCSGITSIQIPASVKSIGNFVFSDCDGLEKMVVTPENKVYNSDNGCNAIIETKTNTLVQGCKNTKIPLSVTRIGEDAFFGCSGLTSISIPSGVTSIEFGAFSNCDKLTYVDISSGMTDIGEAAFYNCTGLKNIDISGVNGIGDEAFGRCFELTSVEIPSSVTHIGGMAFESCVGLSHVKIADGVISIGSYAFSGCSDLKNIEIPSSVTHIMGTSFPSGLEKIVVAQGNKTYNSNGNSNAIIETKTNTLIRGCKNTKIPSGVTSIGNYAFSSCEGLTDIEIPSSVTHIGDGAFAFCDSLISIEIPSGITSIGKRAFADCRSLASIKIPASVTSIADNWTYDEWGSEMGTFSGSALKIIYGTSSSYAEAYAKKNGYTFEAITEPTPEVVADVTTSYRTHVQSIGWQNLVTNGVMSGTSGKAKRLEGIEISVSGNKNLGIQYSTHCQTYGWLPWSANGEMNGTTGEAKRLEAIKIQLTGADKDKYDVYYRVHAQSYGWLGWAKNGEPSGTAGYAKRLEGIQIVVVKKDGNTSKTPGLDYVGVNASKGVHDSRAYIAKTNGTITIPGSTDSTNIMYKTHVQSFGWQNWVLNGDMSGTSGKAKRLEGINIKLSNAAYAGGIQYRTHVQTYGWEKEWKKDGAMSGTSGEAKRLEAIQIKLYGEMANHFDVYYRVHAQSYGWLGWAKNGEESGTAGFAKRLEGIQIVLVPKGGAAPANNYKGIQSVNTKAYIKK